MAFSASLSGDFGKLEAFGERVGALGSPTTMRGLSRALGDEALHLTQEGFSAERDPYGAPWQKKAIPDGRRILVGPTGKLRDGWRLVYAGSDAAIIANRTNEGRFQSGTGIYGPSGKRITPKRATVLSWKSNGMRFGARSTRGAPARLMVPEADHQSSLWNRRLIARGKSYMISRMTSGRAA